jgi:hypothetical protein
MTKEKFFDVKTNWELVTKDDEFAFFFNKNDLSQSDNYRGAWSLINYKDPWELNGTKYYSVKLLYIFSCYEKTAAQVAVIGYVKHFAKGKVVFDRANANKNDLEFKDVEKGSMNEMLFNKICN